MTQKMGRGGIIGLYDEDGSDRVWYSRRQVIVKYSPPSNGSQVTGLIKYQFMMKMGLIKCSRRQVMGLR